MNRPNLFFWLLLLFCFSCTQDDFIYSTTPNGVEFSLDGKTKRITFYNESVARVTTVTDSSTFKDQSLTVIGDPTEIKLNIDNSDQLYLSTDAMRVAINKLNGTVTFFNREGDVYLSEHPDMLSEMKDTVIFDSTYYKIKQPFQISQKEGLYGLGQFQNGFMNYRGKDLQLVQANKVSIVPMLISTKNYGILWENYSHSEFHDGEDGMWFTAEVADQIDYFFMGGESIDDVVSGYRTVTGKAPMFSKKAYGFWQSKERYKSFDELHETVRKYRENDIPLDNIVQDWRYWGDNDYWSSMVFESENYPNPKENIQKLHDSNVDVMISIWGSLGPKTAIFKEMEEKGLLFKPPHWSGGKVYDAYNEEAQEVYWKHLKAGLIDNGVDAIWMDGTEPEFGNSSTQEFTEEAILDIETTAIGPIAKYLNTYSLATSSGLYRRLRENNESKRAFILTRSAWAGQQRNAAVTWSGDVSTSFKNMRKQIAAGINFSMAGIPYWSHDIGGFFTAALGGQYPYGIEDPAYREIYVRWFQFGAFTPIFRAHGAGTPREVWKFQELGDTTNYNALKKALNLRYSLMPYIYSTAWRVYDEDYTVMRGLVMDFPEDKEVFDIADEYMFGENFLVKPITRHMFGQPKGVSEVIPAENLRTPDGQPGLKASFFKGKEFDSLILEMTSEVVDYNWLGGGMPLGVPENFFSVRWEGKLFAEETGEYKITTYSDDGVRLWINDKLVIDEWRVMWSDINEGAIYLESGEEYDIKLEYFQKAWGKHVVLGWEPPSYEPQILDLNKEFSTYLPAHIGWYDYFTNEFHEGGQEVTRAYDIDEFPIFVKAGSIIPKTEVEQYIGEKPNKPLEIMVYAGADATFTLYQDEGDNYEYENGAYATIDLEWDDANRKLTIGELKGGFEGFSERQIMHVALVQRGNGAQALTYKTIEYQGKITTVQL